MAEFGERQECGGIDEWMTTRMIPRPSDAVDDVVDGVVGDAVGDALPSDMTSNPGVDLRAEATSAVDVEETTVPTPRPLPIPDDEPVGGGDSSAGTGRPGVAGMFAEPDGSGVPGSPGVAEVPGAPPPPTSFFPANTGRMRPVVAPTAVTTGALPSVAPSAILPRTTSFERSAKSGTASQTQAPRRSQSASSGRLASFGGRQSSGDQSSSRLRGNRSQDASAVQPRMCYSSQYLVLHAQ